MIQLFFENIFQFSVEILKILPPVLVLMALIEVWISREWMESQLGKKSGIKGVILSLLLGSTAAGPLFAAFPIAFSMKKKGVRTANLVIFLGAWSTIKIPLLLLESNFLGVQFALWRLVITVPLIVLIGYLLEAGD
jgi:uncharacterized membrane protein YraQ (UPF0718 family)